MSAFVAAVGSAALAELMEHEALSADLAEFRDSDPDEFGRLADAVGRAAIAALMQPTPQMLAKVLPLIEFELTGEDLRLAEAALEHLAPDAFPPDAEFNGPAAALDLIRDWREMVKAALE